jgi:hypothetical protein
VSIPLKDLDEILKKHWRPYANNFKGEDMETGKFNFGQIFRLQYSHAAENDYYILASINEDDFCLINLQWGSRMSDALTYSKRSGGVPWTLIAQHAKYFLDKMGAELIPVTDAYMTFNDLPTPAPVFSGEAPIGVRK